MSGTLYDATDIVQAAVDAMTGKVDGSFAIRPWRVLKLQEADLPCFCIFVTTTNEEERSKTARNTMKRVDTLEIDCHTTPATDESYAVEMAQMTSEAKRAILNDADFWAKFRPVGNIASDLTIAIDSGKVRAMTNIKLSLTQTATYEPIDPADVDLKTVYIESTNDEAGTPRTETTVAEDLDT